MTTKRFFRSSCIKRSDKEKTAVERGQDEMGREEEKRKMREKVEERKGRADEPSLRKHETPQNNHTLIGWWRH